VRKQFREKVADRFKNKEEAEIENNSVESSQEHDLVEAELRRAEQSEDRTGADFKINE
jgi:hypothetical protein